ncbi:Hypothetical predicted protein [Paramuricea clavata]|uniref:Uncharacterized protein n=1 Tax=Paramuricea clavata TaxID=317549 RepID=A0A6S7FRX7_PARCT|nr:Hypothetical predicted protein [Paramuricea clavata]
MAGALPSKRGRPKKDEAVVRIRLTKHIYLDEGLRIQTPSSVHHSHVLCSSTPAVGQRKARLFEDSISSISSQSDINVDVNSEFGKHFGNPSSSETGTTSSESDSDSSENSSDFDESFPETEQNLEFSSNDEDE